MGRPARTKEQRKVSKVQAVRDRKKERKERTAKEMLKAKAKTR